MIKMKRKGSALLMVTMALSLLITTAVLVAVNSTSDVDITNKETIRTKLELACESGLKRAKSKIESSFNNNNLTKFEPYVTFQDNALDDTEKKPDQKLYDDESYAYGNTGSYLFKYESADDNKDIYVKYSITEDNPVNNWKRSSTDTTNKMKIEAIAYSPGYGWIGMTENAYAKRMTLFMYQIFFMNDLEILPGADFELKGLIHTNQNLYLNTEGNYLNIITDSLTAAGNAFRGRLDKVLVTGHVNISKANASGALTEMLSKEDSTNTNWTNIAKTKWGGAFKDQSLGATTFEAPKLQSFQPGAYYDKNASISITVTPTATKPYKIKYNGLSKEYSSIDLGGALVEDKIYDYREYPSGTTPKNNSYVSVTNIDINKLKTQIGYPATKSALVYMTRTDAVKDSDGNDFITDPNRKVKGFKIINSSKLNGPITFVTHLPVYIEKSYNKHTSSIALLDTWQPSAIVADSITLLSDAWVNTKSNWKDPAVVASKTLPVATASEYNLAFITGNLPSKSGQYNGGLENYPRFLENWSGKDVKISGSFIQLFRNVYATGQWIYGNYYTAPNRKWQAESRYANLNDLPPEYINLFPSVNIGIAYSDWKQISKEEANIVESN